MPLLNYCTKYQTPIWCDFLHGRLRVTFWNFILYCFVSYFTKWFLDIRKRAVVDIKKIFKYINLKFLNGSNKKYYWQKRKPLARLIQLNHPNNCHDIDVFRLTKNFTGFHQIQINFRKDPRYKIEIIMEDKKQSLSRTYKYNKFGNFGPRVFLDNLTKNHYKY